MAKPKLYPHAYYIRLSDEGKSGLEKTAGIMGLKPAEAGRIIIEHSVKGEPIKLPLKGGKDVRTQEKPTN